MQERTFSFRKDLLLNATALLVAIVAHFWGAYLVSAHSYLAAAVLLLIGQFVLALQIQWRINNGFLISDVRLGFVVFYFLYGVMLPVSTLAGHGGVQGTFIEDPGLYGAAFLYASGLLAFNIVQLLWPVKWQGISWSTHGGKQYFIGSTMMLFVLLYWLISYALSLGVELRFDIDRSGRAYLNIQSWVILVFVLQGVIYYLFWNFRSIKLLSRVVVVLGVMAFILFATLSLGERRSYFPLLLFAFAVFDSQKRGRLGLRTLFLTLVLGAGLFSVGAIRERKYLPEQNIFEEAVLVFSNNEFSIPIQNLIAYINSSTEWEPRYGMTYLSWPGYFVPRDWWPDKPVSLSAQVAQDTGRGVPAYTPVVEAFVNFLWVGPFLMIGLFSVGMNLLVKSISSYPVIYFVFLSYVVDFNRGEFGLTLYGMSVAFAAIWLMTVVKRLDMVDVQRFVLRHK